MLTVPEIVKKLTIKDGVYQSAQAWEEATSTSLSRAWNKLIPPEPQITPDDNNEEEVVEMEVFQQLNSEEESNWQSPSGWLEEDSEDPRYQMMTDDEIVAHVSGECDLSESESEDESENNSTVSHTRAYKAFGIALQWLESQGTDPAHLMLAKNWITSAERQRENSLILKLK